MKLQTPVIDIPNKVSFSYNDKILMLGSCFADNIGTRLKNYGFDTLVNPFGTLYNPQSILNSVRRMAENKAFNSEDCMEMGAGAGKICSFSHHTSFSRATAEDFLENANSALSIASKFFNECNKIIITLGTCWCYRHKDKGIIVSNCLKRPGTEFTRERLSLTQVEKCLSEIIDLCQNQMPIKKDIIFTVSPIRHLSDGAHGNQLSKSTLLLAVEQLQDTAQIDYFPSYEIMMDELRDYRFYAEDMTHPTNQAEEYIFERFCNWALLSSEKPIMKSNIKRYKQSQHRKLL